MSEFIAQIKAELDTSEAEKKLDELTKGKKKVKIEVDGSELDSVVQKTDKLDDKKIGVETKVQGTEKIDGLSQSFKQAEKSVGTFNNSVKGLAKLGAYINVFKEIEQGAKAAVKAVEEIDKSIVDLQMATGDSYNNVKNLVGGYTDFAKQLGATTKEVSSGASDWLRQGKSIAETNKLIENSMVLSKVANISSEDSTQYLTAMMKGYKKTADEVAGINDSLTSIDLAAAVDAGGLADATSRVAATADLAGVSLNKLLGYEAAVGEASQESMSVIGNSFKAIFSRMADIKSDKLELIDEDGTVETISDVETVLKNVGIELRSSNNEFRSFDDVLDDTAKKWKNLSSVQRAAVSKAFAGQRQANRFQLLMENYDTALAYEKIANESSGTAMQKFNDAYLNSIEAAQKSLQASFEGLSGDLISRESINGVLQATQVLVEFLDKTNLLKGALTGLAAGGMLKGFETLTTSITQAAMKMQNFQQALELLKTGNIGEEGVQRLSTLVDGLSQSQLKAVLSCEQLTTAQRMSILTSAGMSEAQATATLSTMGLSTAEGAATASTVSFSSALKGLWATLLANPIVLISTALTAGVSLWSSYKQGIEESIQKATDATTAWKESNNTLDEQIAKYKELKQQLESGSLTPTEEYETRQQILDIQSQITSQYGDQVSGIDLVNGSLQTQLGLMQQISAENAKRTLNENRKEYQDAYDEMTKERDYNLGFVKVSDKNSLDKDIKEIAKSFEDAGISLTTMGAGGGNFNILFKGDATQAEETINDFMNKINNLKSKYTDENSINFLDKILDQSGKSLTENKDDVLSKYQENYKSFLQMDMLSQGTGKGSISDTFNKYTESVQKYNEALASGDTDKIIQARSEFASLGSEVDNILSKDGSEKFTTLFDDVTDQLSEASVKAFEFQEALAGKKSDRSQFKEASDDIQKYGENLKKLKLDAEDVREALITSGKQKGELAIQTLAEAWGVDAESSTEEIYAFTDVLTQAGIISGQVSGEIEDTATAFATFQTQLITAINAIDTVNASLANSFSGKGLSVEFDEETGAIIGDIANIKAAYQGLEGYDASTLFEKTANGIHINRQALRELQAQQESLQKATNLEKIAELQERLNQAMADAKSKVGTEDYASSQLIVNDLKNQLEIAQELAAAYDGATSAYQKWINAQSNGEEGDMFRNVSETMRERGNELYTEGRYNTNEFRAIADYYSNQDLSTASVEEVVRAYESAKPIIDNFFTGNKQGIDNFMASMQQMSDEGNLGWVEELESGAIKFNVSTKTLADSLGISQEAVEALMRAADEYTDIVFSNDIGVDFSSSIDEMSKKAEEAKARLEELSDNGQVDLDLNFNFDSTDIDDLELQIQRATSNLEQFRNQDGIIDLNIEGASDAISILTTLIQKKQEVSSELIMCIDTSSLDTSVANAIGKLQEYQTALNELNTLQDLQAAGVQVDTSQVDEAKAKVERVFSEIQGMSNNDALQINADVSFNTSSKEELNAELSGMSTEILAKIVPDTSALNTEESYDKNATVTFEKDSSEPDNYKPKDKDAKVNYHINASEIKSWKAPNKSAKVNYTLGTVAKPPSVTVKVNYDTSGKPKSKASGTLSSPARASGTAYNVINTIPAYVNGKITLPKDERALVNELGSEGLVRDGVLSWIPGGMHFENLKKGDIILSAEQMKSLFNTGKASGTGKAYANGTTNIRELASNNLKAYANGSGTWIYGNIGSGNTGGYGYTPPNGNTSSNNNSNSNNNNNSSTSSDLDSANDSAEDFKETLDAIEILINRIERDIKNIERVAGSAYNTFTKRNNALKNQAASITEEISAQQQGYNRYLQEAESVPLSEDYKNLVRNGAIDISTITDKDLSENINKYKEWYEKALDCRDAIEELTESVRDLYKEAFDNVVAMYDGMLSQIEHRHNMLEGYVEQTEAQGYIVSTKYYDAMISNEQNKLSKLNKERQDLINAMNDAIVNGDIEVKSEAWYDMQAEINGVNEAIQEANTSIIEFKNSIREIEWGIFDKVQDRISSITDEADFLAELMSDEKMYDDNGNVTKHGTATYGLHGVNYNVYMSQADQYRKEMESIQKELSNDPYNETLIERRKELLELQQESILAAEEEKDAIVNLVKEGIEKQLEALDKLIDKYLDAIDSQKDMYDHQKKISKQQKEIDSLRKQLAAYSGDDSEEGSVKRHQTENKLKEAEESLEESLYDKAISDQKKLLDELYSEYETVLNMRLDNIDVLISEVIANINSDSSEIRDTIVSEADKAGYKLTDSMNTIWGANGTIATILTTYSNNFSSTMTSVQAAINNIRIAIQNAVSASNKSATSNINSIDQQQKQQTTVTKPTTSIKPTTTTKPVTQTNNGGDGVPRIGDKVTYVSGNYFYSSDGLTPSGNQMLGQQVYITNINNASWAKKPYHISRTSKLGERDLGWVTLDQLRGYRTGAKRINKDMLAWTQEDGDELILSRYDGTIRMPGKDGTITSLNRGDAVINAQGTENLLSMAKNPNGYIQRHVSKLKEESRAERVEALGGNTENIFNMEMILNNVTDVDDFINQLSHNNKFERLFEAILGTKLTGKNRMGKYLI